MGRRKVEHDARIIVCFCFANPFNYVRNFYLSLSLPSCNSDPGYLRRLFSPSPRRYAPLLLSREDLIPFFPRQLASNGINSNKIHVFLAGEIAVIGWDIGHGDSGMRSWKGHPPRPLFFIFCASILNWKKTIFAHSNSPSPFTDCLSPVLLASVHPSTKPTADGLLLGPLPIPQVLRAGPSHA